MGAPDTTKPGPPSSALQTFLTTHPLPTNSPHTSDVHTLALQIAHNLRHQHNWTHIRLHTTATPNIPLPRPLLSGIPPNRLYIHPDEQIALLQQQKDAGKKGMPDLPPQREWVLPSHLREKWTLRRFGEVFDALVGRSPEVVVGEGLFEEEQQVKDEGEGGSEQENGNEWREKMPKRLLLATLDDDSTVVYYIVHDGIVKPRQN